MIFESSSYNMWSQFETGSHILNFEGSNKDQIGHWNTAGNY